MPLPSLALPGAKLRPRVSKLSGGQEGCEGALDARPRGLLCLP